MSTTTGPNLTIARNALEALMDDTCEITWDPEGVEDDTLNTATGELTPPNPDSGTIYDASTLGDGGRALSGRCKVSAIGRDPRTTTEGGVAIRTGLYTGGLPWDAPIPPIGSILTMKSSRRDPDLVNKAFIVKDVVYGTFLISRKLMLEIRR